MALPLNEIEWAEPILPAAPDPQWEAEVRRRGGRPFEVDRRIAPSRWLREAAFAVTSYQPSALPERLVRIGSMVTAQENACRYCYGANRAYMKVLGYSEAFIQSVERDVQLAETDPRELAFVEFCRSLARSRPRPSRSAREKLLSLGYSAPEIAEMAFLIAMGCFYNRVATLIACPPEVKFERMANGPVGRLIGLAMPLLRRLRRNAPQSGHDASATDAPLATGAFGPVLATLAGLPAGRVMKTALDGAFASEVLGPKTKGLMFAVIARTLGCPHCEREARRMLADEGLDSAEVDAALATLQTDRLPSDQSELLPWSRDTVSYDTASIQRKTRALAASLGDAKLLEAIGVASLANATVRLAMLLE
jgi:alkylhydroperoxidase family enzyme